MEQIAFKITVDSNVADLSIGQLRKGFRQLQDEMVGVNTGTEEYRKKLLKLGEVKGALNDLKQQINALDPEKRFQAFAKIGSSVASGFAAAQGAMALFGSESEDLQRVLVRVQAAMALAQGLQGAAGFGKALQTAGYALKAFALSNPFTAIAVGIAAAVALIAKFTDGLWSASKVYQQNVDTANRSLAIEQRKLDMLSSQDNVMKLAGKTEKEILESKIKQLDVTLEAARVSARASIAQIKANHEIEKRNHDVLKGYIALVTIPFTAVLKAIDLAGEALGKQFNLVEGFTGGIANLVFDPKKTAEEGTKTIQEIEKSLIEMTDQRAAFQISIQGIDKKAAKDSEDKRKKDFEKFQEDLDNRIKAKDIYEQVTRDAEKVRQDAGASAMITADQQRMDQEARAEQTAKAIAEETLEREKFIHDSKVGFASGSFDAIGNLALAFAGKQEASQRRAFAINKAAGIAGAIIDTYAAANGAYKSQMTIPSPDAPVRAAIAAGIAIASGLARVAVIAKTQFGGGAGGSIPSPGSGGGGSPSIQSPQSQQNAFTTNTTSVNQNQQGQFTGFGPIKAVVVETDITNTQSNIRSIEERTTY